MSLIKKEIIVAREVLEQRKPMLIENPDEIQRQLGTFGENAVIEDEVEADIGDDAKDEKENHRRNNIDHIKVTLS